MAETHEPSYYEIALTNRQVIVAFVILLVCLLSAFLSGVWIGREGTARAAEEQTVRNYPPEAAEEGRNLEELEFFDSRGQTAGDKSVKLPEEAAPPPPRPEETTLLEDLAGDSPAGAAAAETPADDQPAPASTAGEIGAAEPAPDRDERRDRRQPEERETAPPIAKGSVVIQVFSSAERSQAERIRERLVTGGYQAFLSPVEVSGHTMYRVRLGPFPSRDEALKVAEQVRKGYKLDTWVTE